MNKIKYILIILMIFIGIKNIYAFTFDNTIKVYDYAQILTDKEEDKLIGKVNEYINKYNIDMVIVTVKHYEQNTLKEYMDLFYETNEFGKGNNKRGIFIVLDLKNNDIGIETYNLEEGVYTESELTRMKELIEKDDKYYKKINTFIDYSNKYLNENYIIKKDRNSSYIDYLIMAFISLFISSTLIIILIIKVKKVSKKEESISYLKKDSLVINKREDKFLTTHTRQINRYKEL